MATRTRDQKKPQQGALPFRQNGGRRAGSGRKPLGEKAGVSHRPRALLAARFPAHVTMKLLQGLPRLRNRREYASLRAAFAAGCDRAGFRLTHYAVLNDHLHFLVEHAAEGREVTVSQAIDVFTSAPWFDGFRERLSVRGLETMPRPVTLAHTWMLTIGWRRHGLLSVHDLPATA